MGPREDTIRVEDLAHEASNRGFPSARIPREDEVVDKTVCAASLVAPQADHVPEVLQPRLDAPHVLHLVQFPQWVFLGVARTTVLKVMFLHVNITSPCHVLLCFRQKRGHRSSVACTRGGRARKGLAAGFERPF